MPPHFSGVEVTSWIGEESFFYPRELPIVISSRAFVVRSHFKANFFNRKGLNR